jgi:hypothetical protein
MELLRMLKCFKELFEGIFNSKYSKESVGAWVSGYDPEGEY